jgi:CrcB protein
MRLLLVLTGGAIGSGTRYLVALWMTDRFGSAFPWGTMTVNLTGSFLIGLIATLADEVGAVGPDTRLFLVVGFLGGFTTFSALSLDTLRLAQGNETVRALWNIGASVVLGLVAVTASVALGRALVR